MAAPGSICAGRLSIHEYFLGFSPQPSKPEKEEILALIIIAQESNTKMDKPLADCLQKARYFSMTELKKINRRMCCLCNYISKWLDIEVFSDKDYKP